MELGNLAAITFDVGNTLLYSDPSPPELYAEALSRHGRGVAPEEVAPVFREAWAEMQRRTPPGRDRYSAVAGGERAWWGQFVREVLVRLAHDAPWELLLDDLYEAFSHADVWRIYPDVATSLAALRGRGLGLAVISNWDRRLPGILDALGLSRFFDQVLVSAVEGVEKPAPEIFLSAIDRLGVSAGRALHVGDSPREDYLGAEGAGMRSVLVDRGEHFTGDDFRRVKSLTELAEGVLQCRPEAPGS